MKLELKKRDFTSENDNVSKQIVMKTNSGARHDQLYLDLCTSKHLTNDLCAVHNFTKKDITHIVNTAAKVSIVGIAGIGPVVVAQEIEGQEKEMLLKYI